MITFTPMSDEDFAAFIRKSIPEYAYDQMRAGNWTSTEAAGRARSEFQQMLPDGPQTPNAYLHTIIDEQGHKIGMLWYFVDPTRTRKTAFLIEFFVFPEERHKGYEAQALALFDDEARSLGVERVELQIFTHKDEDVRLYRENGFQDTSIFFAKDLTQELQ
ncbi:MAG: GNAT family N-acetyltransferase [Chloroflexi bacterium]|nr:GNAT family N-acetyltransferase [Chloroflexota bacterium]